MEEKKPVPQSDKVNEQEPKAKAFENTAFNSLLEINFDSKTPEVFSQIRIIYFLGKIFKTDLKDYFSSHLREIAACFKEMDIIARDEKNRIKLRNFLLSLQEEFKLYQVEILLDNGHKYDMSHSWENCSQTNTNTEDTLSYLFGLEDLQGYNYGHQIEQCIQQPLSELTPGKQISFLLCFSLPMLSRRLALNGIAVTDFYKIIRHIESLIVRIKSDLSETEKKLIYRFYEACFIYQRQNFFIILKEESDFTEALKKINENYPQGSLLKVQHLSLLLERFSKDFPKTAGDQKLILSLMQETAEAPLQERVLPESFGKPEEILSESRKDFLENQCNPKQSVFKCQENSTIAIQKLLNLFLKNSAALLGEPPCKLGLLLLGSTSRYDRGPYSDLEIALLYEPFEKNSAKKHEVAHYIATLIALLEIQIVFLGESHPEKQGFWLDGSTSVRCHAYLRADVEGIIKKGLREKEKHDKMPVSNEQNPRNLKLHSFLYDPSAYSLVQPLLVNTEYGGAAFFEDYQSALKTYLDETPNEFLAREFFDLLHTVKLNAIEAPADLTKRKMIALWVWWDILRCLPDHVNLSTGQIDLKKTFHKPIAYFLMGLRLYYELPAKNLEAILTQATERKLLPPYVAQFLIQLLEWEIQLRIKAHTDAGKQNETLSLKALLPMEQKRVEYILFIFNIMEKAVCYYLKNIAASNFGFELDKMLKTYFEQGILECKTEKDYQNWFLAVTAYLLYTRALLETHRYYYRQLPDEYREGCMAAAKACFNEIKDTAFWRTDEIFWAKLWDAPLSNGERTSHQINKKIWNAQLNTLFSSNEIILKSQGIRVYLQGIKSNTEGKCGLHPDMAKELYDKKWIDVEGKFVLKEKHPIASRLPGNHLVIPWPLPDDNTVNAILSQKDKSDKDINNELLEAVQASAQFYIKVYPEYPLVELFLIELSYRLGYYPPREADVWLWKCEKSDYPVLISEAVKGKTFQEILENDFAFQLNSQAFSELIVMSGLVSLEDNKPDNLILSQVDSDMRLCLIDADRWFAPAFKDNQLHAKNALFCLKQMSSEIDAIVREEILSLNPQQLLQSWVDEMEKIGEKCSLVFVGKINLYFDRSDLYAFQLNDTRRTLLLPPLPFHAVNELFKHLQAIQSALSNPAEKMTHSQVLSKINTRLANHYSLMREKYPKTLVCFHETAGHAYIKGKGLQQEYYSSRINFVTDRQDMWEKEEELKRAKLGIEANWKQDIQTTREHLSALNEKEETIKAAQDELLKGNFILFLQLGSNGKDKILVNLDWSRFKPAKQREFLNHLMNLGHWLSISIQNSSEVKDEDIQLLIQKSPLLKKLQLINCPLLTDNLWNGLPEYDSSIKIVILEKLKNLSHVGYTGIIFENCLEFPCLEKLSIQDCAALEEINIHAIQLKGIHLDNIPRLRVLQTQSESLENLRLTGSTPLPPLNECHKIAKKEYVEKLNVLQCKTQETSPKYAERLFHQFPVLLFIDYQNIENQIIIKFIRQLSQVLPAKEILYLEITFLSRRTLRTDAEKLFTHFATFEKNKDTVISALIKALGDSDSDVRSRAASTLRNLKQASPKVIPAFIKALGDSSSYVRSQAASALGKCKQAIPEVIFALIKALDDKEYYVRSQAASALVQLGKESPEVISALIKALGDFDSSVRSWAASALVQLGRESSEVISALINALGDSDSDVRLQAASALGNLKQATPEVISALLKALENKEYVVRLGAATVLGNLKQATSEIISALIKALKDPYSDVRTQATAALRNLKQTTPEVISVLIKALGDSNSDVRTQATAALRNLKQTTPEVISVLIKALGDSNSDVRTQAASALGNLKQTTPEVISVLIKALGDSNSDVRTQAASALGNLKQTTPEVISVLIKALGDSNSDVRTQAASALGNLKQAIPEVISALLKALGDSRFGSDEVSLQIASVLVQLGKESPEVISALIKALEDKEWFVRSQVASALGKCKQATPEVISALLKALGDSSSYARSQAAHALVQLGKESPEVISALIKALGDSNSDVRPQAASALVQLGKESPEVISALIKALEDKEWFVRSQAASALENLKQVSPEVISALLKALRDSSSFVRLRAASVLGNLKQATPEIISALLKALGDEYSHVRSQAVSALGNLGKTLFEQIEHLFDAYPAQENPLIFIENPDNWGRLTNRAISKYAFCFFDAKTLKTAKLVSKNAYNISKEIELEREENKSPGMAGK